MGKKKGKKVDEEKKAALQAKKEAKQEKAAQKRLLKQSQPANHDGSDNEEVGPDVAAIDQVLRAYKNQDKAKIQQALDKPTLENLLTEFPLPRANATLEHGADDKNRDYLYLFGGEYFDGIENVVLDELLRFDCRKKEWKQILTFPRPSPRCAHSCVAYKSSLFVFGGEMATAEAYHHYRDLWKFDLNNLRWTEIAAKNPPSARSGHACFVWKHFMVIIGGFFEALKETKWYNDVHVFDLQTEMWMDVPQSRLSVKPEPRSACNVALYGTNKAIVHGGFSKLKTSNASTETKVHTDAWILHLAPLLQQKAPTWERWMSSTKTISSSSPNGRAGTSCISYKDRMVVFGGVVDKEQHHHKVDSIFYNDLVAMDIERRKWFPLRVKDKSTKGGGRRRHDKTTDSHDVKNNEAESANDDNMQQTDDGDSDLEEEDDDGVVDGGNENSGWNLDMLRTNMFAFIDGDGNIVYEKIDEEKRKDENELGEVKEEEDEEEEEKQEEDDDYECKNDAEGEEELGVDCAPMTNRPLEKDYPSSSAPKKITSSSVMMVNESTNVPEPVTRSDPLPRIKGAVVAHGNVLYLHGGILEVGDREITLDDMWSLDLRKRDKWECLWPGTMHKQVWRGAIHDDDDSYISAGKEGDSDDEDDEEYDENDVMDENDDTRALVPTKKSSKHTRSGLRDEVAKLNEQYGLDDENRTPNPGEALADFYSRTVEYWNSCAKKELAGTDDVLSNKELKRQGFAMAKERYLELESVFTRLIELGIGGGGGEKQSSDKKKNSKK
ncbi:galactose oxidase [Nitzschia inconspicua]|uniref:Galactose oxidase n=1 Tax=Nitzschia inconspicua TaxID=303405 RepID=A0A9K3LUV9_9STRA|nr:galactose oxidase [Nitzschia inconspicua]